MPRETITYFGDQVEVYCDGLCGKAWGINNRPKIEFDPDEPDDYAFLADSELGDAPANPGTYEGGEGKPFGPGSFPTKWCVRECERGGMLRTRYGDYPAKDYSQRVFNQPWKHGSDS